jgi:hypothetical protein
MSWERAAVCVALLTSACTPSLYVQPRLPANQLALVTVERRARTEAVDGLPVAYSGRPTPQNFWIAAGCHELAITYEESYVTVGGGVFIIVSTGMPLLTAASIAGSAAWVGTGTTVREYETEKPIRFHIPAKAGAKYWITSSFDGDNFMPRIAVLNEADERVAVILPEQPCPTVPTG